MRELQIAIPQRRHGEISEGFTAASRRVILTYCHPEALFWPKDLPRCVWLNCCPSGFLARHRSAASSFELRLHLRLSSIAHLLKTAIPNAHSGPAIEGSSTRSARASWLSSSP